MTSAARAVSVEPKTTAKTAIERNLHIVFLHLCNRANSLIGLNSISLIAEKTLFQALPARAARRKSII
jgi:hypothetical protein